MFELPHYIEAEAIALAVEIQADEVLIDERRVRLVISLVFGVLGFVAQPNLQDRRSHLLEPAVCYLRDSPLAIAFHLHSVKRLCNALALNRKPLFGR